ncbi:sensor histidine kinase [Sphaerisporangium perillae]|uniref:sensor histidine kinase n=1 Tax=Sphaerisporangium perillae TaxID=2935860 RepID=UPI00200D4749|nr:histidine kinase [Sphaerisporangium perillae]
MVSGEAARDGRTARILWSITPWALGGVVCFLSMAVVSGQLGVASTLHPALLASVSAVAGLAAARARRSYWPLAAVAAVTYVWLAMWPALVVASYYAGTLLRRRLDFSAYAGVVAGTFGLSTVVAAAAGGRRQLVTGTPLNMILMVAVVVALPLVAGLWVRARRQVLAAAYERAERLEREQALRAEQARTQERARIAREMHDVVAHRVSLMVLHAGALEVGTADERTAEAAALIGEIGREALADLRDVLGVLRSSQREAVLSPQPTLADLDRLLDQSRSLGMRVARRDEGDKRPLGSTVERTAYRVVQEALTNVHKHAGDAHIDVRVRYLPDALEVVVRNQRPVVRAQHPRPHGRHPRVHDEPPRTDDHPRAGDDHPRVREEHPRARDERPGEESGRFPSAGWGLIGLRERVELVGGHLEAGRLAGGGFHVLARIPAEACA